MSGEKSNTVLLSFRGVLDYDTIGIYLKKLNNIMEEADLKNAIKKRLYSMMVECLENISKHNACDQIKNNGTGIDTEKYPCATFTLEQKENAYCIESGNYIFNKDVEKLKSKISLLNKLDRNGLKKLYNFTITRHSFSEKGGAGLGLIDIAKASRNEIEYRIEKINETVSYLHFKTKINY